MPSLLLYAADGSKHRAIITQEFIRTSGSERIPGLKTARLEDGTPLNYVDENTFKNVATGELLYRTPVSPKE